jgi:hypothetical protein
MVIIIFIVGLKLIVMELIYYHCPLSLPNKGKISDQIGSRDGSDQLPI